MTANRNKELVRHIMEDGFNKQDLSVIDASFHDNYVRRGYGMKDARSLAEQLEPSYPTGFDTTGRLRDRYIGFGLPATFIIDQNGVITTQIEGPVTARLLEELTTG